MRARAIAPCLLPSATTRRVAVRGSRLRVPSPPPALLFGVSPVRVVAPARPSLVAGSRSPPRRPSPRYYRPVRALAQGLSKCLRHPCVALSCAVVSAPSLLARRSSSFAGRSARAPSSSALPRFATPRFPLCAPYRLAPPRRGAWRPLRRASFSGFAPLRFFTAFGGANKR
jgi:hypothetical protein